MKRNRSGGIITVVHGATIIKGFLSVLVMMVLLFSIIGVMTSLRPEYRLSSESVNAMTDQISGKMLYSLLANENHYFFSALPEGKSSSNITQQVLKLSANISLDDPRSLLGRELPGFSIFDSEILVAGEGTNYTNMPYESSPPNDVLNDEREASIQNLDGIVEPAKEPVKTPAMTTDGKKVVYIYHSHNRESFLPYLKDVTAPNLAYHSQINITKLGLKLLQDLESKGIGSSLEKTDVQANLNKKGLKYTKSYQESRSIAVSAMDNNRDLDYLIDIHRDSKRKKNTTITINGKQYAKIAFVIGSNNPNPEKNIALATKLHHAIEKKYPGLSRGVLKQGGKGNNGVYNQDLSGNAMLLEVGGVDNTFEEMYLTIDAFANVFSEFYWDAKEVNVPVTEKK
ncbi:stage II sporulation protein P [Peribacillus sp. NPDC096379]|uniref:stage II sporulation protein P n=1 Tax=Peribacillus sp. NPDC096379 TaxID=3364393 RepID=UPI0038030FED